MTTTTRNKITIKETMYIKNMIKIYGMRDSEYIRITQNNDDDILIIRTDEIPHLISSLKRFYANGEIMGV